MSIIENIRKKTPAQKMAIIWTFVGIFALLLIAIWVISSHFHKDVTRDTSLFDTIGQGFKDIKSNYKK